MKISDPISKLPFVGSVYARRLNKLEIHTIRDLLYHVPSRYQDFRVISTVGNLQVGDTVTVKAQISSIINQYTRTRKKIQIASISDISGSIDVIWFNQPYLTRSLKKDMNISFAGKVDWFGRKKALISPDFEFISDVKKPLHTGRLVPIYPETFGISSKWLRNRINFALNNIQDKINEYLPDSILKKYKLPNIKEALFYIHFPETLEQAEQGKKRLAFEELLFLHLRSAFRKLEWKENKSTLNLTTDRSQISNFIEALPFKLTFSQKRSVDEIISDLSQKTAMNRLLEGDVGSGKTVVAAMGCFISFLNGYQSVIMAPTQILASQHYITINEIFTRYKLRTSLITSAGVKKDAGRADVVIGTHALIHNKVNFDNVAFVVIDEQHRFGVEQRAHLSKKTGSRSTSPHVLTMTATPIPRTIALTLYGDLDLSTLDELPEGRKPITTWVVPPQKRQGAYKWIEQQILEKDIQAFIICPLIEESKVESMKQVKAVTSEYEKLKNVFPKLNLGLLHGRLKAKEKDEVISKFKAKKYQILVSTPVVEVGIDIPNATIMMIEGADRFGLAQLHQLRGRVGRGKEKSYCLLFTDLKSRHIQTRLNALTKTMSGFELAELDLKLRGPGEVFGTMQHGFTELKVADWSDASIIKQTKKLADEVIKNPNDYIKLLKKLKSSKIAPN